MTLSSRTRDNSAISASVIPNATYSSCESGLAFEVTNGRTATESMPGDTVMERKKIRASTLTHSVASKVTTNGKRPCDGATVAIGTTSAWATVVLGSILGAGAAGDCASGRVPTISTGAMKR